MSVLCLSALGFDYVVDWTVRYPDGGTNIRRCVCNTQYILALVVCDVEITEMRFLRWGDLVFAKY